MKESGTTRADKLNKLRIHIITDKMQKMAHIRAIFSCIILIAASISAAEPDDTIGTMLDEIQITQKGRSAAIKSDNGSIGISAGEVGKINRKMGEADIVSYLLGETGIHRNGDYGSGISVDGASPGQTQYMIDGGPVIFPFRFGGIFSTFNTSHFSGADFTRQAGVDALPGLGAALDFHPKATFGSRSSGEAKVGLLASSAYIGIPVAGRISISASARISYIDQIYKNLIKPDDGNISYRFADMNLSAVWRTDRKGTFSLSFFHNSDRLSYDDRNYALDMGMKWQNTLCNLSWRRQGRDMMEGNVYFSDFSNTLNVRIPQMLLAAPSSTRMAGTRLNVDFRNGERRALHHKAGVNIVYFSTVPQWATLWTESDSGDMQPYKRSERTPISGFNANVYENLTWNIVPDVLALLPSARLGVVSCVRQGEEHYTRALVDPRISVRYSSPLGTFTGSVIQSSQYLHLIGFSELGLSSDFRIGSCRKAPVEHSLTLSLRWNRLFESVGIRAEGSVFCSKVRNQPEYTSQMLEMIDTEYDPLEHISLADGYNYGASFSARKDFGDFTWSASYEYGTGRRHAPGSVHPEWRSLYDVGNAVKANAVWRIGARWILNADFSYASGRVYTPVKSIYAIGGNIAMEYGSRNSARLPEYQRLDVGATYMFQTGRRDILTHLFNLTLINAYGHRNVEMQYFILDTDKGDYRLKRLYSLYRFMPSLSYSIKF